MYTDGLKYSCFTILSLLFFFNCTPRVYHKFDLETDLYMKGLGLVRSTVGFILLQNQFERACLKEDHFATICFMFVFVILSFLCLAT